MRAFAIISFLFAAMWAVLGLLFPPLFIFAFIAAMIGMASHAGQRRHPLPPLNRGPVGPPREWL